MNAAALRRVLLSRGCLCEKGRAAPPGDEMCRALVWISHGEAVGGSCELDKVKVSVHKATARAQA